MAPSSSAIRTHWPWTLRAASSWGDRYNNRIQLFSQEGEFLAIWTQFGRPSGIYIDANDIIYVADSESSPAPNEFTGQRNAGWEKGIRIGDAKTAG